MSTYRNPGQAYLQRYTALHSEEDVLQYVDFLREEAGLSDRPPIDLSCIYAHFGMPIPIRAPLDQQQGILVDSKTGIILIKEDDPIARQRFTEGHELMELLFAAQADLHQTCYLPNWSERHKEHLCDRGSAELLMPTSSFVAHLHLLGISIATGRSLATLYQTSLLATLIRMIRLGSGNCAIVVWRIAHKPSEAKKRPPQPAPKLRIWWSIPTHDWSGGYIPKDKSIVDNSIISQVHKFGQAQQGHEILCWAGCTIACHIEAISIAIGEETCVLSLLCLE
jgi:IrrE N-terminal-like domain